MIGLPMVMSLESAFNGIKEMCAFLKIKWFMATQTSIMWLNLEPWKCTCTVKVLMYSGR